MVERELLLCCARTALDAPTRQRAARLLASNPDWDRFLALAQAQQVTPLVAATLCGAFEAQCPAEVVERLRAAARTIAVRSLFLAQALLDVLDRFAAAGIPVIPYKGPVLSAMAYGGVGLREFGDLDVWVHPWDYRFRVPAMMEAEGWTVLADYSWERSYRHPRWDVVVDVHQSLTHRRNVPFAMGFDDALQRRVDVELGGGRVRTLNAIHTLVVLCVQLAKDAGEEDRSPLIKVCDVAELVRRHPELDWDAVIRLAWREGVVHIVCLGLAVAQRLLGMPFPDALQRPCREIPSLDRLVRHVETRIFGDDPAPQGLVELRDPFAWNAAIRERFRDRNRASIALLQDVFVPNLPEYELVRLPRSLYSLYRVLRPMRLAWKYSRRVLRADRGEVTRR